ncbi:MAG: penicillin-binding protein 1A [Firmicutes bacterium HGW-Firmicutes-15]|nr:MAG: penicillin-binding protein 1A [Firmicutes bacterium HGW-Firmicutes-15]
MASDDGTIKYPPPKRTRRKSWRLMLSILFLVGIGSLIGVIMFVATDLPAFDPQQLSGANTTLLYDDKGQVFSSLHAEENRTEISLDKVPVDLVEAFIATEDKDFYNHHGVNFKGIARALVRNFQSGDMTGQGASTITQQLARSSFLTSDKNWERKIKEMFLAFKLESVYSKEEIMELYLNKIYFGAGAYGVQAAANTYFGKDVTNLTLPESALMAGLVQSPSNYNPFSNFDKAKARQKLVLNSMASCGFISETASSQAYDTQLHLIKVQNSMEKYGYYMDAVVEEAIPILTKIKGYEDADSALYRAGLKIYTTVNAPLQSYAEDFFKNQANFPTSNKTGQKIQVGMAIVENDSGDVKAIMGGRQYEQLRGFNRATDAYRMPGSSIKPLTVYGPALEQGKMPFTVLDDSPVSYKSSAGVWNPQNYDLKYKGLITMRTAVQYSVNTFAVQLLDQVGVQKSFNFGRSLGLSLVDSPGTNDLNLAALGLGGLTKGATPVQMASGYSCFGNSGIYNQAHFINKITDNNGLVIYEYKPKPKRVMTEQTAWLMNNMLQTVVSSGTGTNAKVPNVPTAGKTGTSEDLTDVWFCGLTPVYSGAVWMGYDDQKYKMQDVFGGGFPALMFKAMMVKAHQGINAGDWSMPGDIVQVDICSKSGKLPSASCPQDQIIREYSLKGYVPTETCPVHQTVVVCKESGKLATKYCPETKVVSAVKAGENSAEASKIPTEKCTLHTTFNLSGLSKNVVKVCTDPRNNGQQYQANIANPTQSGGCPTVYVDEIVLQPGEHLPPCPLDDHQIKKISPQDLVDKILP